MHLLVGFLAGCSEPGRIALARMTGRAPTYAESGPRYWSVGKGRAPAQPAYRTALALADDVLRCPWVGG